MSYPLYEELLKQIETEDSIDITNVCQTLSSLNTMGFTPNELTSHYEEIWAIMLHYEFLNKKSNVIPCDGKGLPGNKNFLFHFNKIPVPLQKILAQYIKFYSQ